MIFDFLDKWVKKKENQSLLVNFLRSRKILKMMFAGMMMSFLDVKGFYSDLKNELNNAKKEVIICSPFAWTERLETIIDDLRNCVNRGVKVTVFIKDPSDKSLKYPEDHQECCEILRSNDIRVTFIKKFHAKFVSIDREVFYIGGINVLSHGESADAMLKIRDPDLADVLTEKALKALMQI